MGELTAIVFSQLAASFGFIGSLMMTPEFLGPERLEALRRKLERFLNHSLQFVGLISQKLDEWQSDEQQKVPKPSKSQIIASILFRGGRWFLISLVLGYALFLAVVIAGLTPFKLSDILEGRVIVTPFTWIYIFAGVPILLAISKWVLTKVSHKLVYDASFRHLLLQIGTALLALAFLLQFLVGCSSWLQAMQ